MHPKSTVEIPLTQGKIALIDAEDAERVLRYKWCAAKDHDPDRYYAVTSANRFPKIKMHRLIMDAPRGMVVDHINRDGLDNRRENLRLATTAQNLANNIRKKKSNSGYRGVRRGRWGNWRATISVKGRTVHIGTFDTPEEAARAWDRTAFQLRGEFARLNFPHDVPSSEE